MVRTYIIRVAFLLCLAARWSVVRADVEGGLGEHPVQRRTSSSYRTDICDRVTAVRNGSIPFTSALNGVHLNFATGIFSDGIDWIARDLETGAFHGLEVDILDKVATRGGFTYSLILHDWGSLTSFTNALIETLPLYDMVTYGYWTISPERVEQGGYSPSGFLDFGYTLVGVRRNAGTQMSTLRENLQFMRPFNTDVWLALCACIIITGLVYWMFEGDDIEEYPDSKWRQVVNSIAKSFLQLAGAGGFAPKTWPGKLLLASWAWFIVLFLSAYTANLASYLIVPARYTVSVDSLQHAMQMQKTICFVSGGSIQEWFQNRYPGYPASQQRSDVAGIIDALHSQRCEVAILLKYEYEIAVRNSTLNPECNLEIIGQPLQNNRGGWMVLNDYTDKCTVLVKDVLEFIFLQFKVDHSLDQMLSSAMATPGQGASGVCGNTGASQDVSSPERLRMRNMAGIVYLHVTGMAAAVFVFGVNRFYKHRDEIQRGASSAIMSLSLSVSSRRTDSENGEGQSPATEASPRKKQDVEEL